MNELELFKSANSLLTSTKLMMSILPSDKVIKVDLIEEIEFVQQDIKRAIGDLE